MVTNGKFQSGDDEVALRREYVFDMVGQLAEIARGNGDEDIALVLSAICVRQKARLKLQIEVKLDVATDKPL